MSAAVQTLEVKSGKNSASVEFRLVRPVIVRSAPPLTRGAVDGFVWEGLSGSRVPAPGVTVRLDQGRSVASGVDGRFRLADVPAGEHHIGIVAELLPIEFALGSIAEAAVAVSPGKATTVQLNVLPRAVLRDKGLGTSGLR